MNDEERIRIVYTLMLIGVLVGYLLIGYTAHVYGARKVCKNMDGYLNTRFTCSKYNRTRQPLVNLRDIPLVDWNDI